MIFCVKKTEENVLDCVRNFKGYHPLLCPNGKQLSKKNMSLYANKQDFLLKHVKSYQLLSDRKVDKKRYQA